MITFLIALSSTLLAGTFGGSDTDVNLDSAYQARRVAVLVGVDTYQDDSLTPLRFAGKDARDMAAALELNGDFDTLIVLDSSAQTSMEAINSALDLATSDLQRDDTFLLYLSGHGTLTVDAIEGTRLWFMPSDSQLDDPVNSAIPVASLEERVASVRARRRVLLMDTCHNGREKSSLADSTSSVLAGLRGDPPPPRGFLEVSESEARLFAAQYHQPAMEDSDLENGVYTHFLIESLTTGAGESDLNGDGLVDVTEAHDWARDRTIQHTGGMQVPRAEYRIVGRESIYLAGSEATRTAAESALITAYDAVLAAGTLIVDGRTRGVLPDLIPVTPGIHTIEVQDDNGQTILRRRVNLSRGETLMLESLYAPRGPSTQIHIGGAYRIGPGAGVLHEMAGSIELTRADAFDMSKRISADISARATWGNGPVNEQSPHINVTSGEIAIGLSPHLQVGDFFFGPMLEATVPWRSFEDSEGAHNQATMSIVPGARAGARVPLARNNYLSIRLSTRWQPFVYDGLWTSVFEQSVDIGLGF
jgi:hypothetical protein